jgi:hypothetical protein
LKSLYLRLYPGRYLRGRPDRTLQKGGPAGCLQHRNHYTNYIDATFARINDSPGRVGAELPRPPADIHACRESWCTRGWFGWETDGWPFWSHPAAVSSPSRGQMGNVGWSFG